MSHSPRVHAASFQAQVALAAVTGDRTLSEVAAQYPVPVKRVPVWKKPMVEPAATVFAGRVKPVSRKESEAKQGEWFEPIGRLKMELEWLKKKCPGSCEWKRQPVEPGDAALRVRRQRERLGLARSRLSFEPASASDRDLSRTGRLDRLHLEYPFFWASEVGRDAAFAGGGGEPEAGATADAGDGRGVLIL